MKATTLPASPETLRRNIMVWQAKKKARLERIGREQFNSVGKAINKGNK